MSIPDSIPSVELRWFSVNEVAAHLGVAADHDDIDRLPGVFGGDLAGARNHAFRPAILDRKAAAFDPAEFADQPPAPPMLYGLHTLPVLLVVAVAIVVLSAVVGASSVNLLRLSRFDQLREAPA